MENGYIVATINMERVLGESAEGERVIQDIRDKEEPKKLEFQRLVSEIQSLQNKLVDGRIKRSVENEELSEETKAMVELFERKQREAAEYQQETLPKLEQYRLQMMAEFEKHVWPVIDDYCKENGIDLLFPYPMRYLVFSAERLDVTDAVIARIDRHLPRQ